MGVALPASPATSIEYLAQLDHWFEKPSATKAGDKPHVPQALVPQSEQLVSAPALGRVFPGGLATVVKNALADRPALNEIRFSLVDLTEAHLDGPDVASQLDDEQAFGASLVKIVAMVAAHQLQYDLNVIAKSDPSLKDEGALFRAAYDGWLKTQVDASKLVLSKGKKVRLKYGTWNGAKTWSRKHRGATTKFVDGAPNLANIFRVVKGSPIRVEFQQDEFEGDDGPGKNAHAIGEHGPVGGKPFYERMYAMIDASNNTASMSCILDVGYLYIASTLRRAGLFDPARGGLWLGGTFRPPSTAARPRWVATPAPMSEREPSKHFQVATAGAVARLMMLLAQGRLVSPRASAEMEFLLGKQKPYGRSVTRSPVEDALEASSIEATVVSKLGLNGGGDQRRVSDGAIVRREAGSSKNLLYAVCLLDLDPAQEGAAAELMLILDAAIQRNNGL